MATPARYRPRAPRPYAVTFRHTQAAPLPARIEALVLDAQLSFAYTTGLQDGTRSEQLRHWTRVLESAVRLHDPEAAAAWCQRLDEQVAAALLVTP